MGKKSGLQEDKPKAKEEEFEYKTEKIDQPITQEKKDALNVDGWKICHANIIGQQAVIFTLKRPKNK